MAQSFIFNLAALVALLPATIYSYFGKGRQSSVFWLVTFVAVAGSLLAVFIQFEGVWRTGFSLAIWITIVLCILIFAGLSALTNYCWRLGPLLLPYLVVLGFFAMIWSQAPEQPMAIEAPLGWLGLHIVASIVTYAILTIAAVSAVAVFLQESALKSKRKFTTLNSILPSVVDAEGIQIKLMISAQVILLFGLLSGMATQFFITGDLLVIDHKVLLTFAAFLVISGMIIVHFRSGLRGRKAARIALTAYLLVTLGYPGVKFVRDVLLV